MAVKLLRPPFPLSFSPTHNNLHFPSVSSSPTAPLFAQNCKIRSDRQLSLVSMATQPFLTDKEQPDKSALSLLQYQNHHDNLHDFPILVNSCSSNMGRSAIKAALSSGLQIVPVSFSSKEMHGKTLQVEGVNIHVYGSSKREEVLASVFAAHPDLIVVDYTVPQAVNGNAELYCKVGVPFVMGTTGGNIEKLFKTVEASNIYALISPQMAKQVVGFLANLETMAKNFPNIFRGHSLEVIESHQASKLDTSGTAKEAISIFQKLGLQFQLDQIQKIRDPEEQLKFGVPEEYLDAHAFHTYRVLSPDKKTVVIFGHNLCGRSAYAEGSIDAAIFLAQKIKSKSEKRIYNMIDVLREGGMR